MLTLSNDKPPINCHKARSPLSRMVQTRGYGSVAPRVSTTFQLPFCLMPFLLPLCFGIYIYVIERGPTHPSAAPSTKAPRKYSTWRVSWKTRGSDHVKYIDKARIQTVIHCRESVQRIKCSAERALKSIARAGLHSSCDDAHDYCS